MEWFPVFVVIGLVIIDAVLRDLKHVVAQAADTVMRMEGDLERLRSAAESEPPRCPRCGPASFDDLDAWATPWTPDRMLAQATATLGVPTEP